MTEYEILIETINPCGGSKYAKKEFVEAEAESPEAYVAQHGKYPVGTRPGSPRYRSQSF